MLICLRFCQDRRQRELDANPRDNRQQITYAIVAPNAETTNIFLELAKSNEIARVEKNSKKSSRLASPRIKRKASDWFQALMIDQLKTSILSNQNLKDFFKPFI